jgi:hypothetical protein
MRCLRLQDSAKEYLSWFASSGKILGVYQIGNATVRNEAEGVPARFRINSSATFARLCDITFAGAKTRNSWISEGPGFPTTYFGPASVDRVLSDHSEVKFILRVIRTCLQTPG